MNMETERILRLRDVEDMVGFRRSQIYVLMSQGEFPRQIKLGQRGVGWKLSEIKRWIDTRPSN